MTWAMVWVLLAAAAWLASPARPSASAPWSPQAARRAQRRQVPVRLLQVAVAFSSVTACVATLGPRHGLLASGVLAPIAVYLVTRLAGRRARASPDRALALTLDLAAAALRVGAPVASALALAAPAAGSARQAALAGVASLLRLGADPEEAWNGVAGDDVLAPVAHAACRSANSGIRLACGFEQVGADVRSQVRAAAEARAHRAAVLAMAPLGLCFLPAFVCLGVAPVIIGIAKKIVIGVP
ncbi:MAG: type II secretion system F family protein [Jatrophihabitantaceae bacterium]